MPTSLTPIAAQGPKVSRFIAGYWRVNQWNKTPQELLRFANECLELGISTVDHAMVYRSEATFGKALALDPGLRSQLQIVTKFGIKPMGFGELGAQAVNHYDSSSAALIQSLDASLQGLGTDYIDILLVHRPDYLMDVRELAATMASLRAEGKVRYFGVSNFNTHQFEVLQRELRQNVPAGLVTNQIEFSPLHLTPLEDGTLEQCQLNDCRPMLWSCLGGGNLLAPASERHQRIHNALRVVADEHAVAALETIVYAWVRALPCAPLPLLGTSNIERVKTALAAEKIQLTREQWYRIWEASTGHPVP